MPRTRKKNTIWAQFIFFIDAVSWRRWRKEGLTLTFIVGHNKAPKTNNTKRILNSSPHFFSCRIWFSNINNGNFPFPSQYMLYKSFRLLVHLSISTSTPLAFKPKINSTSIGDNLMEVLCTLNVHERVSKFSTNQWHKLWSSLVHRNPKIPPNPISCMTAFWLGCKCWSSLYTRSGEQRVWRYD